MMGVYHIQRQHNALLTMQCEVIEYRPSDLPDLPRCVYCDISAGYAFRGDPCNHFFVLTLDQFKAYGFCHGWRNRIQS